MCQSRTLYKQELMRPVAEILFHSVSVSFFFFAYDLLQINNERYKLL